MLRSGVAILVCAAYLAVAAVALAAPPHVAEDEATDACAMCHRTHTTGTDVSTEWSRAEASRTGEASIAANAMLVGVGTERDDTTLCYSCHGRERLGSVVDVQSSFEASSGHVIAPGASAFGRTPKQCSTCHDAHGESRVGGEPRAALLRSIVATSQIFYEGAEYCASCHADRTLDRWDGLAVWKGTAHASALPTPTSGTGIVCSVCHAPHGSDIAPAIQETLTAPAVLPAEGIGVAANDRELCLVCHLSSGESWVGSAAYAPSAHGSSAATVPIVGEWAARDLASGESSRAVGECQVCHAPMGRSDDQSGTVPKMLERAGRRLCDDCHDASGPARSNVASLAFPASRVDTEMVAVWRPSAETSSYGDIAVHTRDLTTTVPASLDGPRVFRPSRRTGDASAGDLNGDGRSELVVGDAGAGSVDIFWPNAVSGLRRGTEDLGGAKPSFVLLANVIDNGVGPHGAQDERAELVVVDRDPEPPHASELHVFTYDGTAREFDALVAPALDAGLDASDIAAGNLDGDEELEVVVTSVGDDIFSVFDNDGGFSRESTAGAGSDPRGVSIGDVDSDSAPEIVVCESGVATSRVSVFRPNGTPDGTFSAAGLTGAEYAYDSVVADVQGGSAPEIAVVLRSDPTTNSIVATSSVTVFSNGFGSQDNRATGERFESSAIAAGDVDGDGEQELIVGNSGRWLRTSRRQAPSVQVFDVTPGPSIALARTLWSTGVEQASGIHETTTTAVGTAPALVVADLGAVGPSRHPGDAGSATHVSTETAGFDRHVTCADCHNSHEATATVPTAPGTMYGAMKGAYGVKVTNTAAGVQSYDLTRSASQEYEVCLKCHSTFGELYGTRDVASEVNTRNASTHGVQSAGGSSVPATTFASVPAGLVNATGTWAADSQLFCTDCHSNDDATQARGPHVSSTGALLRKPFWGVTPANPDLLCYTCHKRGIYYDGASGSLFRHYNKPDMHMIHTKDMGFSCRTCHVSHGAATLPHLQNPDHQYEHLSNGGACTTECHTGGARHAYSQDGAIDAVQELSVSQATAPVGSVAVGLVAARNDAQQLVVEEGNGDPNKYSVEATFNVPSVPTSVEFYGRYQGSSGHVVGVWAWDFAAGTPGWAYLGRWSSTTTSGVFTFALNQARFRSAGGTVRVRVYHESPGNTTHRHYIDSLWLNR